MSDAGSRTPDVQALTAVLAERVRAGAGPDPEPEELLDYLEGRLSPDEDAAVARRLVASPEATRRLLDLADLAEAGRAAAEGPAEDAGAPADLAVHAAWRDLERRRAAGAAERAASPRRRSAPNRTLVALAATLFVAVLALGVWVWRLDRLDRGTGAGDTVPVANLRSLELTDATRSNGVPTLQVEPGLPFRVVFRPEERCSSYSAEVVPPAGSAVRLSGLEQNDLGNCDLLLPGEPGRYTLRVFGCEPERQISSYGFEIEPPARATSGGNAPKS